MEAAARVLRLFRLTVPPVFFLLACYVFLGEHVFGLAYVIAKRLKTRARLFLRVFYYTSTIAVATFAHIMLLYMCIDEASACPPMHMKERNCLAITASAAVYCGGTLLIERWTNPMLDLGQPTGVQTRAFAAAGVLLTWMCIADQQLCAHLLLLLFTARRALVLLPRIQLFYALGIKGYTVIHMSRILTRACNGIPKLAVATVAAMAAL